MPREVPALMRLAIWLGCDLAGIEGAADLPIGIGMKGLLKLLQDAGAAVGREALQLRAHNHADHKTKKHRPQHRLRLKP